MLLVLSFLLPGTMGAQEFVNLTPKPKAMTVSNGTLTLPAKFAVSCPQGVDEQIVAEAERFVKALKTATGYDIALTRDDAEALIQLEVDNGKRLEGSYGLSVTTGKVTVKAMNAIGFYYAFQTIRKILPANVMAGVADPTVTTYALPCVSITDEPRFAYRGFMLDVSRHFFTTEEVKRMIDLMSYYKLNRFHWHLSDDQGWRVEIKKYPKLTSVGSISPNSRFTDMYSCTQYWINKPYGPYFYTQEEIKDVVAYAKERHIEIIPEIDMPGHFVAALAAYPEFSCHPSYAPTIWSDGGISSDVLNVANPKAVQFVKDVLEELMQLFPYETLHIGGDECPTTQWQSNAECQALMTELGLTNARQLQSHFIKEINAFVQEHGRKLAVWNEAITASGADAELIKNADATVYCWTSPEAAAQKAQSLGLKNIYTPWGPYYINRKQGNSQFDPPGAGTGSDHVKATYNRTIPAATDYGVQGTFWTEHVSDREYMEWLALPRLIAVAEAGWTPQANRDFEDFRKRMTADTTLLNYGDYKYCTYFMLMDNDGYPVAQQMMPKANTDNNKYYYRIISGATDATRQNRCIELLAEGSSLISEYSGKGAAADRLWTNVQAAEGATNYDYQWWSIEADPAGTGKYALVCKALPDGSVNPNPTAASTAGRWTYDKTAKHYNFELGKGAYGATGSNYYYSLSSDQVSNQYLNSSMGGQGLAVNVYGDPSDGAGGQWQFAPLEDYGWNGGDGAAITFDGLTQGKTYTFSNTIEGFDQTTLADVNTTATNLTHSTDAFAPNAWTVTEAGSEQSDGTQVIKLVNAVTGRSIAAAAAYVTQQGCPVTLGDTPAALTLVYDTDNHDYRIRIDGKSLFPLPTGTVNAGSTISGAGYDAPRLQGTAWTAQEVRVITLNCRDDQGNTIGTYTRSIPANLTEVTTDLCPTFKNMEAETLEATADDTYTVNYKRLAYSITIDATDTRGALLLQTESTVPVGESYTMTVPEIKYYQVSQSEVENGTQWVPDTDRTISVTYTTDAYTGAKEIGKLVTDMPKAGQSYLLYDASPANNGERKGYKKIVENNVINRVTTLEGVDPNAVWTLEANGTNFKVKNEYTGRYVPVLQRSQTAVASNIGDTFTFTANSDGTSWCIRGTNGMMWDGERNGDLVGWNDGSGHPIEIYTYVAMPYYTVTINCTDTENTVLGTSTVLVPAGQAYPIVLPPFEGYTLKSATGNENYGGTVEGFVTVNAVYESKKMVGITEAETSVGAKATSIYDLQGRRLNSISQRGIYIINGQKVLVK